MEIRISQISPNVPIWPVSIIDGDQRQWKAAAAIYQRDDGSFLVTATDAGKRRFPSLGTLDTAGLASFEAAREHVTTFFEAAR